MISVAVRKLANGARKLQVAGETFNHRRLLGAIPALRWHQSSRSWAGPATPSAALEVGAELERAELAHTFDDEAETLRQMAVREGANLEAHRDFSAVEANGTRWRHQVAALSAFAHAGGGLLYMGMGTGKTFVALDQIEQSRAHRVLIVAPRAAVLGVWPDEITKHGLQCRYAAVVTSATDPDPGWGIDVSILNGSSARKAEKLAKWLERGDGLQLVGINYETIWRPDVAKVILATAWDIVFCDEIQRIKSAGGKASRFMAKLADRVPRRFGLSGTPCPHSPLDAYGVYRFLDAGIFGLNYFAFRARYAILGGYEGRQVVGWHNEDDFNRRFYSIAFRADSDEVLDLPEAHHVERVFDLPRAVHRQYQQLAEEYVTQLSSGETITAANALAKVAKLQQMACGHVRGEDGEWKEVHRERELLLVDILDEIPPDEPVGIFCRFILDYDACHRAAAKCGRGSFELTGRLDELRKWKGADKGSVLIVSPQSGAEGVDLTAACHCILYSHGTSLGQYEQGLARFHRPGQTRRTIYLHLVARGTVDRKLIAAHRSKRKVLDEILADPRWLR